MTLPAAPGPSSDFARYIIPARRGRENHQLRFRFPNGYEASVINDGFGSEQGLYEMALLLDGEIVYNIGPFGDDILGYLTYEEVIAHMETLLKLPPPMGYRHLGELT